MTPATQTQDALSTAAVPRKSERIAARVIDGRAVIVVLDQHQLHTLNEVGTRVFELCDGQLGVQAIAKQIVQEFEVEEAVALSDVQRFVQQLSQAGALELSEGSVKSSVASSVASTVKQKAGP